MLLSYVAFLFLCLIIPPPGGGGVNKDCLPAGPFFFCAVGDAGPYGCSVGTSACRRMWAPAPTRETGRTPRGRLLGPQNGMVPPVATVHGVNMPPAGGKMVSRI